MTEIDRTPAQVLNEQSLADEQYRNECLDLIRHYSNRSLPVDLRALLNDAILNSMPEIVYDYSVGTHIRLCRLGFDVEVKSRYGDKNDILNIDRTCLDQDILLKGLEFHENYRDFRKAFDRVYEGTHMHIRIAPDRSSTTDKPADE